MDPLSITASIIAVLQLTSEVIKYLDDVKDAPKDRARLVTEASNLYSLLMNLKYRLEEGHSNEPWYNAIKSLNTPNGPFDQYKDVLEELQRKTFITSRAGKVVHALIWKFNKAEVDGMLSRMERLKNLIQISLQMDHLLVLYQRSLSITMWLTYSANYLKLSIKTTKLLGRKFTQFSKAKIASSTMSSWSGYRQRTSPPSSTI